MKPGPPLKGLKKRTKDIVELTGKAEKLAKKLHPRDEEAAERHAVDALDKNLAMEVQKLGHRTMEEVIAATRRNRKDPGRANRLQDGTIV